MIRSEGSGLRKAAAVATTSLAVALTAGIPAVAAAPADGADLVTLSVESGELKLSFRSGGTSGANPPSGQDGTDPQSVRFTTASSPAGAIPDDPAFAFLGKPGTPVWSLQEGSPFSTFDTTAITGSEVTLELAAVDGPGTFAAYTLSEWGRPTLLLDSDGRRSTPLPTGSRVGGVVWLFDAVGEYRVTLRATSRTAAKTLTDEATYTVSVPAQAGAEQDPAGPKATEQDPAKQDAAEQDPAEQKAVQQDAAGPDPAAGSAGIAAAKKAAVAASSSAPTAGKRVISDGHVDMGPQLDGDRLTIRLKDDSTTPPTWRELADVTLKVTGKARIDVPEGAGYSFLGKAGDKVFLLPQSQQSGIVWPGWNTQHESVVKGAKGDVTWRLKQVSGPGEFKLFLTGSFGTPEVIFDSGRSLPQQLRIAPNTHAHGNWAFTKAGAYQLTVEMTATTTAGKSVSDTRTLTFAVGDATPTGDNTPDDSGTGTGTDGGNDGGLARTGTDVVSLAAGGTLLLAAGTAFVVLARRRRGHPQPS